MTPQPKPKTKSKPGGRPTAYTPEIGEKILAVMAEGLSITAAAAEVGIHRDTVYAWEEKHPDFSDTIKMARAKRQAFLERRLLSAKSSPVVTSTIFALKNAAPHDWRDKQEFVHETGEITVVIGGNANE